MQLLASREINRIKSLAGMAYSQNRAQVRDTLTGVELEAPDANTVREVYRLAGHNADKLWMAEVLAPKS